jgi:glycosyltransferase involved in cell wall biosynthesis
MRKEFLRSRSDNFLTVGHLPPPVTGENLCRARLEEALRSLGKHVKGVPRSLGAFRTAGSIVIINGRSLKGTGFDLLLTLWALLMGRRVYWYFHNVSWRRFALIPSWLWLGGARRICAVALCKAVADSIGQSGYQTVVLPNRVEALFETEVMPLPKPAPKRLLWMGRPDESKGFPLALKIAESLHSRNSAWYMDVYGADDAYAKERGYGRKGVAWHGFISGGDKVRAYCQGGIFILSSLEEVQPLATIEAMACGVPIVASNVGSISEMLHSEAGDAGISLSSREVRDYVAAIHQLHRSYDAYSGMAKAIYRERFSSARFTEGVKRIFGTELKAEELDR